MNYHIQITHNEALLLNSILSEIRAAENTKEQQEIVADVSFRYKAVEQRLITSVISKLSDIRLPKIIKTSLD
jgi:hypothetical protein